MKSLPWRIGALLLIAAATQAYPAGAQHTAIPAHALVTFALDPATPAIATCLPAAQAQATVVPGPLNDTLTLHANGLPPFAAFDLYLTALPHAPFGLSWPLSTLHADAQGAADAQVQATLLQAAGVAGSPSPATHLVLFFDNPRDADQCFGSAAAPTTPYNASHNAGPAVLATTSFPDAAGPLQAQPFGKPGLGISTPGGGRSVFAHAVTFTNTCNHPDGWTSIRFVDFRLTQNGSVAFWARLDRPAKRMYLYDPATRRWLGGNQPGSAAVLSTPYAQLHLATSNVIGSTGTTGRVLWSLSFSRLASGKTFQQSVQVTDVRYQTRGWNPSGTWSVE